MGQVIWTEDLCFKNFIKYPNIHIEEKTVTFISGISGCGKSVLLKLLNGTISPSNGRVFYLLSQKTPTSKVGDEWGYIKGISDVCFEFHKICHLNLLKRQLCEIM